MTVQLYWAALLAKGFGYSLATLRLSTLTLSFFGSVAFYGLMRGLQLSPRKAAALSLVHLCSPYLLVFSYDFMTDVQFVSWMVVALFLLQPGHPHRQYVRNGRRFARGGGRNRHSAVRR